MAGAKCSKAQFVQFDNYNAAFHGKLRDVLLNGPIFYTLKTAKILATVAGITTRCGYRVRPLNFNKENEWSPSKSARK